MIYKQPSIDVIGDVISSLEFPVNILEAVNNGGGSHTLSLDNMYHAQPGFKIIIGTKEYTINNIYAATCDECGQSTNDIIHIEGDESNITEDEFNMYRPFFFYGTPIQEGAELGKINPAKNKTPMFWLRLDDFSETFFENQEDVKERKLQFRLYPLSQSSHEKWETAQAKPLVIDPMHRLAEIFVNKILSMPERFDSDNLQWNVPAVYAKFGVISVNKGITKEWWSDKLGGVELSMDLTVFKRPECDDCTPTQLNEGSS